MASFQRTTPEGVHRPNVSGGQGAVVRNKWQLLRVVEDIRETLGLKGTSMAVLRAMLSFLKSDDLHEDGQASHICFASNAALARRAHVSVQTVERHIGKLVSGGLLTRHSSGNGKRWARRDHRGEIVIATGLSLLPLVHRHAEFLAQAETLNTQKTKLSLLRDQCRAALARLRKACPSTDAFEGLINRAQTTLRRKPDGAALNTLLKEISAHVALESPSETPDLKDSDRHSEGHKEPDLTPLVKKENQIAFEVTPDQMQRSYPKLCAEMRFARTAQACSRLMHDLAGHLDLRTVWPKVQALGPTLQFMVLGYLFERVSKIKTPRAYALHLLKRLNTGAMSPQSLLVLPRKAACIA